MYLTKRLVLFSLQATAVDRCGLVHHFSVKWKEGFSLKNALLFHLVSRPVVQKALGKKTGLNLKAGPSPDCSHSYVQLLCSKKTEQGTEHQATCKQNQASSFYIHLLNNVQIWNYEISLMIKFCWTVSMKSINTYTRVIHNKCIMHFWQAAYSAMKLCNEGLACQACVGRWS